MTGHDDTIALILEEQRRIDVFVGRRQVAVPPGRSVLVIGPHPDDNLLGPGGTTMRYLDAGAEVSWVCVTDGRACVADPAERRRLAAVRAEEERACAAALGLPEPELYGIPEDRYADADRREQVVARLRGSLQRAAPDAVFVPYFLETHPLHRLTTHLAALALRDEGGDARVYSYPVASFPPPSLVVDISDLFARKRELCGLYASQLELRDYAAELQLLNGFFAGYAAPPATHAEVFLEQTRHDFVGEILSRGLDRPASLGAGVQPLLPEGG